MIRDLNLGMEGRKFAQAEKKLNMNSVGSAHRHYGDGQWCDPHLQVKFNHLTYAFFLSNYIIKLPCHTWLPCWPSQNKRDRRRKRLPSDELGWLETLHSRGQSWHFHGKKTVAIRTVKPVPLMRTRFTHTNKLNGLRDTYLLISKSYTSY